MDQFAISVEGLTKNYPMQTNKPQACLSHLLKSLCNKAPKTHEHTEGYFTALDDLSFQVPIGSTLGIIGLNGSGKSTLLQILAGTLKPSSGRVKTHGKISAILELGSGFNPDFTGSENIKLNSSIQGISRNELGEVYSQIISYADIGEFIHQPVRTYSSGMLVRLAFAVCIHTNPDILIVDEALAVGDARFQAKCFQSILNLQKQGKTILFVSHDVNSVAQICNSAILLHHGQIRAEGDPGCVINDYSKVLTGNELPEKRVYPLISRTEAPESETIREKIIRHEVDAQIEGGHEYSYGGEKAIIKDFSITDESGDETQALISGKTYSMAYTVQAIDMVKSPIYTFKFRNTRRQEIYGTNSLFAKIPTEDLQPGVKIRVRFKLKANLIPGIYFISIGLTRFEHGELEVIHRRYDIREVHVHCDDGAFGIANCHAEIHWERINANA